MITLPSSPRSNHLLIREDSKASAKILVGVIEFSTALDVTFFFLFLFFLTAIYEYFFLITRYIMTRIFTALFFLGLLLPRCNLCFRKSYVK